ncbi:DEAD/DEAH box helicase [Tautonia sociabilis]|uniref:Helicase ATP-binding domain-containing protein n=1 Tax=Tautonia sociabilis TaxID=2080755 RepID=A0A432MQZ9_9BACT|nr:DEAD/DEAH box helicase family protein [Tautonia sociabilis]RUL89436.1 hypothetical protein TsocGM_01300 [Tautonia sociabilis]
MQNELKDRILHKLRHYVGREKADHKDKLMDHQVAALERSLAFLSLHKGESYGIAYSADGKGKEETGRKIDDFFEVVSATGTGKTRMMGCLAKACDVPTLFLTPRNVINDQTKKEFCEEIGLDPDDVGVYDGKQPRAAKARAIGQKYLITTYQSLPSLLRQYPFADAGSEHYRPLVLLDEVHMGKGPQTAKEIKGLLRKSIVAGFTATEAGERQALFEGQAPIFQLKIVPAIEKDLLCEGVRTGVIDVNIDEQWLKDFKPPGAGVDFREADVARFVNSPAVIKGAIDFHFNEDPEHLARLDMGGPLHRLPAIFYTQGVDAARRGAELFNQTATALGKSARADYVSGEMSKTVRDAKLEAFRTGQISALWNDSVLEMGFNDRNATVGYMLRPTRVTHRVEQPLGRFARKPTDDYAERFYPDIDRQGKIALAINVRAPNMNPLLFGEVLEGRAAVFSQSRPQPTRPTQPPGMKPWPSDIEVHIDYDDVSEVVTKAKKARDQSYGEKSEDWINYTETCRELRTASDKLRALWDQIAAAAEAGSAEQQVSIDGLAVTCAYKATWDGKVVFCINRSALPGLAARIGLGDPEKSGDEWMARIEFLRAVGTTDKNAKAEELWSQISDRYAAAPEEPVVIEGHEVKCGTARRGNHHVFCLHADQVHWFREHLGIAEKKGDEWASRKEAAAEIGWSVNTPRFEKCWKMLEAEYATTRKSPITVKDYTGEFAIECGYKSAGPKIPFCIKRTSLPRFSALLAPEKGSEWLDVLRAATTSGYRQNDPAFRSVWSELNHLLDGNQPTVVEGIEIKCTYARNGRSMMFAVNAASIERFREAVRVRKEKRVAVAPGEHAFSDAYAASQMNLPAKDAEWMGLGDIRQASSPHRREIRKAVDPIQHAYNPALPGIQRMDCWGHSVRVRKMLAGTRPVICVNREDWAKVEQAIAEAMSSPAHAEDRLRTRPITSKDLAPGSDDLKRTGHSRSPGSGN